MYDEYRENFRIYKGHEIKRTDPYGHWVISGISGAFTTTRDAMIALDTFMDGQSKKKIKRGK